MSAKNENVTGWLPSEGIISAEELCLRLRLKSLHYLKTSLQEKGITGVNICGKTIYDCRDIPRVFLDLDE